MSVNKFKEHILIIPEDLANQYIANGVLMSPKILDVGQWQILPNARGWNKVIDSFEKNYSFDLSANPKRNIILLMDFDSDKNRRESVWERLSKMKDFDSWKDRVFIFGSFSEPEELKTNSGHHFEEIGKLLLEDCPVGFHELWRHPLLEHNIEEAKRFQSKFFHNTRS